MKLVVTEHVDHIIEVEVTTYQISIDTIDTYQKIPMNIGLMKGDLIGFRGAGDPVRIPAGSIAGRVLSVDPNSESGWSVVPNGSSTGSSVTLHNATGTIVPGGTIVKISHDYDFVKATAGDTSTLFVTAEECDDDNDVVCYGVANTICHVLCTEGAVAVNDMLGVSETDGVAEVVSTNGFAKALTAKESGVAGSVEAIIVQNGFLPLTGGTLSGDLSLESALPIIYLISTGGGAKSFIKAYPDSANNNYGNVMLMQAGGNLVIGAGEFPQNAYDADKDSCKGTAENVFLGADGNIYIYANANTIANAVKWTLTSGGVTQLPNPLAVLYGGTGAATAAAALANLGITYGTGGKTSGTTAMTTGSIYLQYE